MQADGLILTGGTRTTRYSPLPGPARSGDDRRRLQHQNARAEQSAGGRQDENTHVFASGAGPGDPLFERDELQVNGLVRVDIDPDGTVNVLLITGKCCATTTRSNSSTSEYKRKTITITSK